MYVLCSITPSLLTQERRFAAVSWLFLPRFTREHISAPTILTGEILAHYVPQFSLTRRLQVRWLAHTILDRRSWTRLVVRSLLRRLPACARGESGQSVGHEANHVGRLERDRNLRLLGGPAHASVHLGPGKESEKGNREVTPADQILTCSYRFVERGALLLCPHMTDRARM
jgi:hypothetical protein